jgi:dipeptidase E
VSERRLLLLSNSRDASGNFLHHPRNAIREFLGSTVESVLFVPFASVTVGLDAYAARARAPFLEMGYGLESIHEARDPIAAVEHAAAIVVGGGNTFHLLRRLYDLDLLGAIRARVAAGVPYLGWSAGSVITGPTIGTTNDMPIIEPPSLRALGLVPFQINAHYTDFHPPGHQGETRAERLAEFLAVNPGVVVVGLREGAMLRAEGDDVWLHGQAGARVFTGGNEPKEYEPGASLSFVLRERGEHSERAARS